MQRLLWYIKQLFPFTYVTDYCEDEKHWVCVWKMWIGRCFDIRKWEVRGE
jgi:hypothetical protein